MQAGMSWPNNSLFLFWQEEFPVDYGPKFDQELEKLLWEFLIRLDQLLPVPNLAQVVGAFWEQLLSFVYFSKATQSRLCFVQLLWVSFSLQEHT